MICNELNIMKQQTICWLAFDFQFSATAWASYTGDKSKEKQALNNAAFSLSNFVKNSKCPFIKYLFDL